MTDLHPQGGVTPATTRVMNLAHFVTRNARRLADRPGFIWGERQWTWREIDAAVSALAAGLAVAVFLVTWLRPVRVDDRALTA